MTMENLNKANFFNEMQIKYPRAMKKFCDWIDEYKRVNNWDKMFRNGIKYHDLTIDMQMGIFSAYLFPEHIKQNAFSLATSQIEIAFHQHEQKLKQLN